MEAQKNCRIRILDNGRRLIIEGEGLSVENAVHCAFPYNNEETFFMIESSGNDLIVYKWKDLIPKVIFEEIINAIKRFSEPRQWKYGLRQKYLYLEILKMGYLYENIQDAISTLEELTIIYPFYRDNKIYWFISKQFRE